MYYCNQDFFYYLIFQGVIVEHRDALTRAGVCIAATGGRCGIADYIESRSQRGTMGTREFLELIFLEQFFLYDNNNDDFSNFKVNASVTSSLVEYLYDQHNDDLSNFKVNATVARSLVQYGVEISQEFQEIHGATFVP
ncbi:unnamed protein product [Clonostachys rhizophaga]|uniref:Uncharacterized protein n=1 Tax=Clonostachys rhizophaga TaxID=160324 RepID=A0A9N9YPK0_9HYPO|nr:unnamed protein product [Clonostachys rhizophaga]